MHRRKIFTSFQRATAGIGTNLFLAKVALDIRAKHAEDFIGYLDINEFKNIFGIMNQSLIFGI